MPSLSAALAPLELAWWRNSHSEIAPIEWDDARVDALVAYADFAGFTGLACRGGGTERRADHACCGVSRLASRCAQRGDGAGHGS